MQYVFSVGGGPVTTITKTATDDSVSRLSASEYVNADRDVIYCLVYARTNAIKIAFGVDPEPDGLGLIVEQGDAVKLNNVGQVRAFRWCNARTGVNAVIDLYREVDARKRKVGA